MLADGEPAAYELARVLYERIRSDEFQVGDRLPLGRELAEQFHVEHNIPHRAYQLLGQLGFVRSKRGIGTFLVRKPDPDAVLIDPIREIGQRLINEHNARGHAAGRDELLRILDELEHDVGLTLNRLRDRIRNA